MPAFPYRARDGRQKRADQASCHLPHRVERDIGQVVDEVVSSAAHERRAAVQEERHVSAEAAGRLVAEMYRKRQWIGQVSQVQPQVGTTAYSRLEVEIGTAMTIERYKMRFLP